MLDSFSCKRFHLGFTVNLNLPLFRAHISFETHIEASIELQIPLIVHSREAETKTFEILKSYKNERLKILMHCFTGSMNFSKKLLELDAFFSASRIITFKNALDIQETFTSIPKSKLLVETDSPYLAPMPNRGKKNEPSFIKHTVQKLADLQKVSFNDMRNLTSDNFNILFSN